MTATHPTLQGDRTTLRPVTEDDLDLLTGWFSDPDMIRVGADYYLTGTTMHAMPGLPILHSRDLVNWKIIGYAFDRLDLGPAFRLESGQEAIDGLAFQPPDLNEPISAGDSP